MKLTKEECGVICEFIETYLFDIIRRDDGIDNIDWLVVVMGIYEKAKEKLNETN